MTPQDLEKLRYPIGKFVRPTSYTSASRAACIAKLAELPGKLRQVTYSLTDAQLDTPYRPEGWTSRQIVHHLADSHINSFCRFKLALTEDVPAIKGYNQAEWIKGPDATLPISASLSILDGLHSRLVHLTQNMSEADFNKKLTHNEWTEDLTLDTMAALYAWHGEHHMTQIIELKERSYW